ncbi:hypothetical protein [Halanaerobaculum tunisiense]
MQFLNFIKEHINTKKLYQIFIGLFLVFGELIYNWFGLGNKYLDILNNKIIFGLKIQFIIEIIFWVMAFVFGVDLLIIIKDKVKEFYSNIKKKRRKEKQSEKKRKLFKKNMKIVKKLNDKEKQVLRKFVFKGNRVVMFDMREKAKEIKDLQSKDLISFNQKTGRNYNYYKIDNKLFEFLLNNRELLEIKKDNPYTKECEE